MGQSMFRSLVGAEHAASLHKPSRQLPALLPPLGFGRRCTPVILGCRWRCAKLQGNVNFFVSKEGRKILNFPVFSQQSYFCLENRPISTLSNASSCDVKGSEEKPHLSRYLLTAKFNYPQLFRRNVPVSGLQELSFPYKPLGEKHSSSTAPFPSPICGPFVGQPKLGRKSSVLLPGEGWGRQEYSPFSFPSSCDREHDFPLLLPRLYAFCAHMQRNLCGICAQRRCPSIIYRRNIFISFLIYSPIASW